MAWLYLSVSDGIRCLIIYILSEISLINEPFFVVSYVRMLASPALYNVGADYMEGDDALVQKRGSFINLVSSHVIFQAWY